MGLVFYYLYDLLGHTGRILKRPLLAYKVISVLFGELLYRLEKDPVRLGEFDEVKGAVLLNILVDYLLVGRDIDEDLLCVDLGGLFILAMVAEVDLFLRKREGGRRKDGEGAQSDDTPEGTTMFQGSTPRSNRAMATAGRGLFSIRSIRLKYTSYWSNKTINRRFF